MQTPNRENKALIPNSEDKTTILRCSCCGAPYAKVIDGRLVVVSHHHGQKHANSIALDDLKSLG